jgi:hypothetical protein
MTQSELTDKSAAYAAFIETWATLVILGPAVDMRTAWQLWYLGWKACEQKREADPAL